MARITSYPVLSTVSSGDWIPITDTSVTGNPLKNITVGSLEAFIIGNIPVVPPPPDPTLQSVITAGNTYQGSGGPFWTWNGGSSGLVATSGSLSTSMSERFFRAANLSTGAYIDVESDYITLVKSNSFSTEINPNKVLASNVTLQLPLADGVIALVSDIPASPWVPVTGGINYPANKVGINTALPQEVLDVTGNALFSGNVTAERLFGNLDGVISTTTVGTTQVSTDNSTKIATTAFVANAVGAIPSGLTFQGEWDATLNIPDLSSLTPSNGDFWIVSVAGATNLGGITDWQVGDWAISVVSGGTQTWQKIDNSSVLTGTGTGQKIAKWGGTGTSLTLTDSLITENGANVGIGTSTANYPLTVISDSAGAGFNISLWSEISKTGASTGSAYGGFFSSTGNSTALLDNVIGSRNYARDIGAGDTTFIVGASHLAIAEGGGTSAGVYGVSTKAQSIGTGTQSIQYLIGSNTNAELDNPNAAVQYLQGAHHTIKLGDGEVTDNAMAAILDFDYTGTGTITGDFEYLRIQNDALPVISGTSRAINSLSILPSVFAGSLESTGFIKTGGAATEFLMADGSVTTGSFTGNIPDRQITFGNATNDGITSSSSFSFNDSTKELFVGGTSAFGSAKITEDKLQIEFNANLRAALQFRNSSPEIYFKKGSAGTFLQVTTEPTQENFIALPDKSGTVALLDDVVGTVTGTGSAGFIPVWSSTSGISAGTMFELGTFIGIGTQTPTAQLETTENILVNSITIGAGIGLGTVIIGQNALSGNGGAGNYNTAIGAEAMVSQSGGFPQSNVAVGRQALQNIDDANSNAALGAYSMKSLSTGSNNTAVGSSSLSNNTTGDNNIAVGYNAGDLLSSNAPNFTPSNSIFIGCNTRAGDIGQTNQIVIGHEATGLGSNTATIGASSITETRLYGDIDVATGDVEVADNTKGLILSSPDGTRYRVTVANGGALTVTAV